MRLTFQHPNELWDSFLGLKLDDSSYDVLIEEDADVFTPEGELLFQFRKKCLPLSDAERAFEELRKIKTKTTNRGVAAGKAYLLDERRNFRKDGKISNTPRKGAVQSSIIGFFDRFVRTPFCRQTAFNANQPKAFAAVLPFLKRVDASYREINPERYAKQAAWAERTSKDFVIPGTSFTTVTVNQNFQTAVHTDQGDLKEGLSCILVLRAGEVRGGILVFPHYRTAVRLDTCDLLLFDSHHMHGNTPIFGKLNQYTRVSLVLYYRAGMIDCGSAAEELERAKHRKRGDSIKGSAAARPGGSQA